MSNEYFRKAIVVNTDFGLSLFSEDKAKALKRFKSYLNETDAGSCLEYEEKYKLTDDKVISYLSTLGIKNISELQQIEKVTRDDILRKIKLLRGITLRQLSRITGISKSVLGRI